MGHKCINKLVLAFILLFALASLSYAATEDNLVLHYNFEQNVLDQAGSLGLTLGSSAVYYNTTQPNSTWTNNSLTCNNPNSRTYNTTAEDIFNITEGTLNFWVRQISSGEDFEDILRIGDEGVEGIQYTAGDQGLFQNNPSLRKAGDVSSSPEAIVTDSNWHMITFLQNSTGATFLIDNVNRYDFSAESNHWWFNNWTTNEVELCYFSSHARAFEGQIDEVKLYDVALSREERAQIFTNNVLSPTGFYSLNITATEPGDNTQYNTDLLNLNATISSSETFNVSLYVNGILNQTKNNIAAGSDVYVGFNLSFGTAAEDAYGYYFSALNNLTMTNSTNKTFYLDKANPTITANFSNNTAHFNTPLTGSFNLTDGFLLFSYNFSIDGLQFDYQNNLNTTQYIYNLSLDVSNLSIGNHTLKLIIADGHTSKKLGGDFKVKDGLFNNKLIYEFWDRGGVNIKHQDSSIFDKFTTEKKKDRYTFDFKPNKNKNSYSFEVDSDLDKIEIVSTESKYKNYLIIGNHWLDFVLEDQPQSTVDIQRVNDYSVIVTVGNLDPSEVYKFSSIGDLNIIEETFSFSTVNMTATFTSPVSELDTQTVSLAINISGTLQDTNATLFYNGTVQDVTKTVYNGYHFFNSTFVTPQFTGVGTSQVKEIVWQYDLNFTTGIETGNASFNQTVNIVGIDNCSSYGMRAYNLTIKDEVTKTLLNGTIGGYFQVWSDNPDNFINVNLSWSHGTTNSPVSICISANETTYYSYGQMEYSSSGYATKSHYFSNTSFNNNTKFLDLFLNNGTSLVTFTVRDFNDNPIEDVIIKVLSYDVATNAYTLSEVLKSDTDGVAIGNIVLNSDWYAFILEIDEVIFLQTLPTKITSTSKTFRINLASNLYDIYDIVEGVSHSLTFTNSTSSFSFTYNDPNSGINEACIKVVKRNIAGDTTLGQSCSASTSGTILYNITEDVGKNTYTAFTWVVVDNNEEFHLGSLSVNFDNTYKTFGQSGIFASFLLVVTMVMVGIWSPVVAVILLTIGVIASVMLKVFYLSWEVLISFTIIAIITIYRMRK